MDYSALPDIECINKTIEAVKARGIIAELIANKEEALKKLTSVIPSGASIMTGASLTLNQIGFEDLVISGNHPWKNLKIAIIAEKDPVKQRTLRKQGTLADYFLGSVHAIAETGEIVIASATGSQLPAYVYSSDHVIWVVGAQKITPTLDDAIRRVREYSLPLESQRLIKLGATGATSIGKLLIFEREASYLHHEVMLLLVNEVLGI
jgi:L-lactate utilization protein LutC